MFESEEQEEMGFAELNKNIETREKNNEAVREQFYGNGVQEHEIIELKREPSRGYPGTDPGSVSIKMSELNNFIVASFREAGHNDTICATAQHWSRELEGILDETLSNNFRRVSNEIYKNRFDPVAMEQGRKEILEMILKSKTIRRDK